ncbi:hypothetical protein V6Z12_D04G020700 [Gossypium hirsutum]
MSLPLLHVCILLSVATTLSFSKILQWSFSLCRERIVVSNLFLTQIILYFSSSLSFFYWVDPSSLSTHFSFLFLGWIQRTS